MATSPEPTALAHAVRRALDANPDLVADFIERLSWRYPSARRALTRLYGSGEALRSSLLAFTRQIGADVPRAARDSADGTATVACVPQPYPPDDEAPHVLGWISEVLLETLEDGDVVDWTPELRAAIRASLLPVAAPLRASPRPGALRYA